MKKILFSVWMLMLLFIGVPFGISTQAQTVSIDIGHGTTTTNMFPFNNFYKNSYNQMIYYNHEVGEAGYIGAIAYDKPSAYGRTFSELTIWMAHVSDSVMTTSSWVPEDSLHQVFHAMNYMVPDDAGELMIVLDSAFHYDGNRHLAIIVSRRDNGYTSGLTFNYTTTSNSCLYRRSDADVAFSQHPGTNAGVVSANRPNISLYKNVVNSFCFPVPYMNIAGVTENAVSIVWPQGSNTTGFEVAILDTLVEGMDFATAVPVAIMDSCHTFNGLSANTTYLVGVRQVCGDGSYTEWTSALVTTTSIPIPLPFACDFESFDNRECWTFDQEGLANTWVIDTAADWGESSLYGMYITNDSLHMHAYDEGSSSVAFAKCLLQFLSAGEYNVKYDWICGGEQTADYLRMVMIPANEIGNIAAGTILPSGFTYNSLPDYAIAADGGNRLNLSMQWQTYKGVVDIPAPGNYYLVAMWRNDGSISTQPPAGIDNIVVEEVSCAGVDSITVSDITATTATLTGYSASGDSFILCYKEWDDVQYDTINITSPYQLTNLRSGTYYNGFLRSSCGESGDSYGFTEFQFGTECTDITLPWDFGAECTFMTRDNISATYPYCWNAINGASVSDCWESTTSNSNVHSGSNAIYFDGTSSSTIVHDDWLFTPAIDFTGNDEISFWVRTTSSNTGNNYHGRFAIYASNADASGILDTANYDALTLTGNHIVNNVIDIAGNEWQRMTIALPNTLVGVHHLAFVVKDIKSYMFCLDDIYIYTNTGCAMPDSVTLTNITSSTATLTWASDASVFTVYYGTPNESIEMATTLSATTNSIELTDLVPNTTYEFRVVALCGDDMVSALSYPYTFTTTCAPMDEESLPLVEDFTDNQTGANSPLDDCWIKGTNYSTKYPYVTSLTVDGERNKCLYFYSGTNYYSYVALPTFGVDVSSLMMSCKVRRYTTASYSSDISFGLMSNPFDVNSFTPYDTLSPTTIGEWTDFQVSLSNFNSEDGQYIAFLLPEGRSGYAHVDDITIALRGTCDSPVNPTAQSVSATTAVISWEDTTSTSWVVYYGEPGFNIDTVSNPISVMDTHAVELSGLAPQTNYEFVVVADCGNGDFSAPSIATQFTTACAPIATLPYIEDFEAYNSGASASINPCWNKFAVGTLTQYPYPATEAAITGAKGLFLASSATASTTYNCYTTLPMFTEPITNLQLKFNMKNKLGSSAYYAYYSKLAIGVMSNPNDLTTFDTLFIADMSDYADGTIMPFEFMFGNYTGQGEYIALLALDAERGSKVNADNKVYIDDVEVSTIPTCHRPTQIEATTTANTANITWVGNATSYEVMYSKNRDMSDSTVVTANADSVQLTMLDSYTYYYVKVRGICSDSESSEWSLMPYEFRTVMDCGAGYQHFVDTIGNGINKNNYYTINASTTYKNCRNWMIYTDEELAESGLVSTNNRIHSISVQVENTGAPVPLRIYMAETNVDEFSTDFSDTIAVSQMTLVYDDTIQFVADSWNELLFDTEFIYSDTMNLMIAFERNDVLTSSTYFYYDVCDVYRTAQTYQNARSGNPSSYRRKYRANMAFNICGDVPNCVRPRNITITDIDDVSISMSWMGTASSYQVAYGIGDFNPNNVSTADMAVAMGNSVTLQNLTPQSRYNIYIRSVCDGEYSIWSNVIKVTTPCSPVELPYSENFDSYPAGTSVNSGQTMDPCWYKSTNSPTLYPHLTTNESPASSPNCIRYYGAPSYYSYTALPMFNEPITNTMMTFKLRKTNNAHGALYIGVMVDPQDLSTFQKVAMVQPEEVDVWENFEVSFANYTGTGHHITILMPDSISSNAYVDNLEVFAIPTCQAPINLDVPSATITTNSAVVQWVDRSLAPTGGYEIEYGVSGFTLGTGTRIQTTTNPTTINNLSVGTCYDVYVRALCSATDTGRWSYSVPFCTDCGPTSLPVTYDFESYEAVDEIVPHCFNRYNDATSTYNQDFPQIDLDDENAHSGLKLLYFNLSNYSSYAENSAMLFPEVDTLNYPMNGNQMVFWGKSDNTPAKILVGVAVNPLSLTSFTVIDTITLTPEYTEYTVSFADYTGLGTYPTIAAQRPTVSTDAYIDDVTIEQIPVCPRVYDLTTISANSNSAILGWTDTIGTAQWILNYRSENNTINQTITVSTNPYTVTGLTPTTKYYFNVRPICASGDTTDCVHNDAYFWTTQVPATIPYNYDFEDETEWNNWATNSNINISWYRGEALSADGTHSIYISRDEGATRSSDWDKVVNAVAYRDIDFGTDTSSFTLTFQANVGGTLDHNYDGVSVLLVDPTLDVISSNANITTPWGHVNDVSYTTARRDTTWNTYTVHFERVAGVQRLAFYWFNQSTGDDHPYINASGAVDNIHLEEQTCLRPYNLEATNIEATSALLTWSGDANDYEVAYRMVDDSVLTYESVQGLSLAVTNLVSSTEYVFFVRSICSGADTSYWSNSKHFETICERYSAIDTIREDFTNVIPATYSSTEGYLPDCWEGYSNGTNGVTPHVVGSGSYWYAHDTKSLVMTSGSTNYGDVSVVRLPYTVEPVSTLELRYWMCTESATNGALDVGYLTGPDLANDFVSIKNIPASDATAHEGNGNQAAGIGIYDTVTFENVPPTAQAIAFRWIYNTSFYSVCIDDVEVVANITCASPVIETTTLGQDTASLSWIGTAEGYQLLIKESSAIDWSDTITTTENNYTFHNLNPETQYMVQLRALCGDENGNSMWVETTFITEEAPCIRPEVTVAEVTNEGATFTWTQVEGDRAWEVHVFNTILDTIVNVTETTYTIDQLVHATEYQVAVRVMCGVDRYSDWSDTVMFSTLDCLPVNGVTVSDITTSSVTIHWTADDEQSEWEINYGDADFGQGEGEFVTINTTTYTITNLEENSEYDVYVRAICGDDFYSVWSEKVQFTTLKDTPPEGIDGIESGFSFRIHPNPTKGVTTISLNGVEGEVAIHIVDMSGRILMTETLCCGNDCEKRVDVDALSQGTYFVRIVGDNINSVRKLIIK